MTALILQSTPLIEMVALRLEAAWRRLVNTVDAFAESRVRAAVPERRLREVEREIKRHRRLLQTGNTRRRNHRNVGRDTRVHLGVERTIK